jgi:hypothetical protein
VIRYGFEAGNNWIATNEIEWRWHDLFIGTQCAAFWRFPAVGHRSSNVLNAMAALIVGHGRGIPVSSLRRRWRHFAAFAVEWT